MRYQPIPSHLFSERRVQFARRMVPNSIAIFYSNDPMPRNGDQVYPFRQDSDLFALSGLDQEGSVLVICPEAKNEAYREIAFILPQDPEHAIWHGHRYSLREASGISGITTVRTLSQWDRIVPALIRGCTTVYINPRQQDRFHSEVLSQNDRMAAILKSQFPKHTFAHAHPILRHLAMIKHPVEIAMLKHAAHVTGIAFDRVLNTIRPGMKEYEVEAEITYTLARHGCHHAFEPIVASGKSACTLHYTRHDRLIKKNDLVLLDFGAEYACMASDMTRTIPASGRFTPRQREMYMAVLKVLNEITSMMRPGVTIDQLNKETGKWMESELIRLGILHKKEVRLQDASKPLYRKYFMHGISHHLGYDVHDPHDRQSPLKAGMVLTCEPGLYVAEEKTGIRLENDVFITRGNPVNLLEDIPILPDDIEAIMLR